MAWHGIPPFPAPVPTPLTFAHEAALAVVHDLGGDQGVVGHGVVPHGREAAVLLQGCQRLWGQWAPQEAAEALGCATQVLGQEHGQHQAPAGMGTQQEWGQGWGHSRAHLVQLLIGDVEDVQEVPLAQPALDMVKPGAVVHWGEVEGDGGP